jgi:nucleotide-binding universal stress UspA family protein
VTIVYGYDFSEASIEALPAAAAIAARLGTRLLVVHATDPRLRTLSPELERALDLATGKKLEAVTAELRKERPRLEVRTLEVLGHPLDELQAIAVHEDAALLIVASGGSLDPRARIGGLSERLAQRSEVPILVMREPGPWLAWASGKRSLRAVLGVSRDSSCDAAVEMATRLRTAAACDVVVTEVYFAPELANHYGFRAPLAGIPDPELEQLVTRDLGKRASKVGGQGDLQLRPSLAAGRPAEPLLDLAERERVDLVIVGRHLMPGPFGIGSVSRAVLHAGRMSVLIVPAGSTPRRATDLPRYERLLAATDLTQFGNQAVHHALALAAATRAELSLVHVADPQALEQEDAATFAARLRRLVPEHWPLPVWTEVVSSRDPSTAIAALGERIDADAICVASHGRKGLTRAALGSVAEELIRKTHRPVLVIRPVEG